MSCVAGSKILPSRIFKRNIGCKKICTNVDSKIPLIVNCPEENIMENNTCIRMYVTVFCEVVKNEAKSKYLLVDSK